MAVDPRSPVVVGVGAITQHGSEGPDALDALELMVRATERAGTDTGAPAVLGEIDLVLVPRGTWDFRDPGRVVAERFGASGPRSVTADIGVLQQTLLTRAAQAIVDGDAEVVLVCGAEAKQRAVAAARAGVPLVDPDPSRGDPDEMLRPAGGLMAILSRAEIERDLAAPAHQYALLESAIGHAEGRAPAEQQRHAAELWARCSEVAAENPVAWDPRRRTPEEIATVTADNRLIAMPYTKLLCSQWNVDQAAAVVVTSAGGAAALGISADRQIFAHAAAESNQMVHLPCRDEMHRWPAFEAVVDALGLTGPDALRPSVIDLYSCFPAAVQVQARALGLPLDAPLTVSGGMTFGGGPLNNAVLQAMVPFVQRLRAAPDELGLITSVSGILTKPGGSLWSAAPPDARGFRSVDVTEVAQSCTDVRTLVPDAVGPATVAAHTVVHDRGGPAGAVTILDVDGGRTIARSTDPDVTASMCETDWVGRSVQVTAPDTFVA